MPTRSRPQYGPIHQRTSRQLRAEHVARHGWVCPGDPAYDHPLHESRDLVADHTRTGYEIVCRGLNTKRMAAA